MKRLFALTILLFPVVVHAQNMRYARFLVDTLTSATFWGRGYTQNGMGKAADFLEAEFKKAGLTPFQGKFQQEFSYLVNTFPGKMEVSIDGKTIKPGHDFIVSAESRGVKASGDLQRHDSVTFFNTKNKIEVALRDKLTWSVLSETSNYTKIEILKKSIGKNPKHISVNIENKFIPKFKATNVCGFVKGTWQPDSLLVITAHYDHLGGMGANTYFPGANDNASGIALLISLAQHYAANPIKYSVVFIAFGGEEAGLRGSEYFVQHPLFSMHNIRFLTNLDLTGTGEEGIAVVNASVFKNEFSTLQAINHQKNYFSKIKSRGKAANSDHYWFSEKGVPSFFIYAMGGIQAYHDVFDRAETLPLTEFADLFALMVDFNSALAK